MNSDLNSNFTPLYLDFALKKAVFTLCRAQCVSMELAGH